MLVAVSIPRRPLAKRQALVPTAMAEQSCVERETTPSMRTEVIRDAFDEKHLSCIVDEAAGNGGSVSKSTRTWLLRSGAAPRRRRAPPTFRAPPGRRARLPQLRAA